MSNITVKFIGKEYSIPTDIVAYVSLVDFTNEIRDTLMASFKKQIWPSIDVIESDDFMIPVINEQVAKFVRKLLKNDIYDRTVNDYLQNNKGYELFLDTKKKVLRQIISIRQEKLDTYKAGVEGAICRKESSVTGLDFGIISSSFVNHMIYSYMDASKQTKQEQEALKTYNREIAQLDKKVAEYDRREKSYISDNVIPAINTVFTFFAYELLDKYVSDLIKAGKFNKTALDYIDLERSNDLLQNLELSNKRTAILESAFVACPFNIAVYMQTMKYDLLDYESFQTAKLFKHDGSIISFLEENLGGDINSEKRQLNFKNVKLVSLYSERSLREVTSYMADYIVDGYSQIIAALTNTTPCYNIMNKVEESDILAGDNISKQKADLLVDPLAPAAFWDKLTLECGHDDLFERLLTLLPDKQEINSKEEYDDFLKGQLFAVFETIRQVRASDIRKQKAEKAREKEKARREANKNKVLKMLCFVIIIIVVAIVIALLNIKEENNKAYNEKSYQDLAGEFCVYSVINDDGKKRNEFNWWLSVGEDGSMQMASWSYAFDNTKVDSYSGALKNETDFRKFEDYRIEDYCADISEYEEALYCYEFHIADEWDEFDGYIVCWQYHNGKIVDVYCDDYRYSFVETSDDYSFNKWEGEINSDNLSKNVQKLVDDIDVSEEDVINEVENLINGGRYDKAVEAIVASKLSDEQKNTYYDSLVKKIDFKSFDVNGLVINIPDHWCMEDYSDPYIRSARDSEEGSLLQWYIKCMGTVEQVAKEGDDYWTRDNDYSSTTVAGCEEAYVRRELSKIINGEVYSVIEHYVVCEGFVFEIQYFAYDERFFEPEAELLLERVDFEGYANAEIQAKRQEQTYINANNLLAEGEYEEAIILFEQLGDYKDAKELITTIVSLQLQEFEDYKASCVGIGDLPSGSYGDVKVYVQVKSHIRNDDYYVVTEGGRSIKIWNRSSREELIEGEWITIYGYAYGLGDNMTIDVEYIDE